MEMKKIFFIQILLFFSFISIAYCLKCYNCYATSLTEYNDDCAFGRVMEKETCDSRQGYVCTEYKYKFTVLNITTFATSRGCQKIVKGSMCEAERLEAKKFFLGIVKLNSCYICDKDLCNGVIRKRY